jgi:DNA sulfur modification protein DndD
MKLEKVELKDVRQFVGEQVIGLSTDADRKVTLVHGPNTAGKTTLLNAIYWCFYGTFLEGFSEVDRLKSDQSQADSYYVEVRFEHRGKRYVARRVGRGPPTDAKLTVLHTRADGSSVPHPQPELLIGSILPQALAEFFFFAGETMHKELSSGTSRPATTNAIRAVLGLRLAEQAIEDLKEVRRRKYKELQSLSAGTDLAQVSKALEEADAFIELRSAQLSDQRALIAQLEAQRRDIFEKLRGIESSSALQQRRERIHAQQRAATDALKNAEAARQELVAQYGAALFLSDAAATANALIKDGITKRRIPSPFDKTFVQDILSSQLCICHRPVLAASDEYRAITQLINTATDEASMNRTLAARGVADRIVSNAAAVSRVLTRTLQQYHHAQTDIERLEQEEARIKDLLLRHEEQNVRENEQRLENIDKHLVDLASNRRRAEEDIAAKQVESEELRKKRDRATAITPQVERARQSVELIEALIRCLETELQKVEKEGIDRIRVALNRVVANSTRQKYAAEVTADYAIKLFREERLGELRPVLVLSSGERRLLSLCFISALVSVCRERERDGNAILLPGAVAPLIVDAAFGELDPEYQALAATTMMQLSEQVIFLLSKTHWTREVDTAIRPFIGTEYLLVGYRSGPPREAAPVDIEVNERVYSLMHYDSGRDFTEIQQIGGAQ